MSELTNNYKIYHSYMQNIKYHILDPLDHEVQNKQHKVPLRIQVKF